ncbi:tRNA 4-thiouridine(8) synthase ThiI [Agarivorans sp. B2Z047]|uniref:tRNA uracil 4-sulfurtransferase ThiI n=1 Tax=Agarivorans sp. B2Z047 TaxID=2652721 RepID=UPI00128C5AD4|nr:tRNA uracil 4-sulfurtransferase ThiI [Agarivorans sp. B2Z047]MPW29106.1 tRNA 4-thiouridine(8) synthase ThiI [Agarivorans sp. B2Z047]UQN41659.1 tRNA 4-thiouridine(8) synthase ThiI [Agarivorans sp. B2Z047]
MKFIVKLFPEIAMKSKPVRKRFSKILQSNIRNVISPIDETIRVRLDWDRMVVTSRNDSEENREALIQALSSTPGIVHFLEVKQHSYTDLHNIYELTFDAWKDRLKDKTFCVRVKRSGKHDFSSIEVERYVGGGLNQHCESNGVRLKNPDVTVKIEIADDVMYLVQEKHPGLGGFPIATQESVLSLISGGFDSGVSSYQLIKRGAKVHYCFFNLGGRAHELGVKQVAHHLWKRFGSSHRVKFVAVDFDPVVNEILEKVDNGQMGVVLKRMMVRAASKVAQHLDIPALVTGEAVGQVSSQTLVNLSMIDRVSETLILRPLIATDKQDIIDTAKHIGTNDFAETMPEYCGVISNKPTVKAVESKLLAEEENFDFAILDKVVEECRITDIRDVTKEADEQVTEVLSEEELAQDKEAVVLDIRSIEEQEQQPFSLEEVEVKHIPFFKLATQFGDLDQSKHYMLYCDRGVMSKLQALYLQDAGFKNVGVYSNK